MRFLASLALAALLFPNITLAHVVVRPAEVGIGAFQTFTIGVPTEKDIATVGVRLVIPEGLEHTRPNVKPGWKISIKKTGEGEEAVVSEISWTGGWIPADQRDDFFFSAKVPSTETKLLWKAYQTYSDGSVVSWDVDPVAAEDTHNAESAEGAPEAPAEEDFSKSGPYSVTTVVDDLNANDYGMHKEKLMKMLPLLLSIIAIGLAIAAYRRK